MRTLNLQEVEAVSGGIQLEQCTPGNSYGGVHDTVGLGGDLINIYEGAVFAMSHVIERVANAF